MSTNSSITKSLKDFIGDAPTMKIPKRGKSKESFSDAINMMRRALADQVFSNDISMTLAWKAGVKHFDFCCYICKERIYDENFEALSGDIQADHVIAPIHGGTGSAGNMLPAHRECNDFKGDASIEVFFADNPETLKKIYEFQKMCNYNPASKEKMNDLLDSIEEIKHHIEDIVNQIQDEDREPYVLSSIKRRKSNDEILDELKDINHEAYFKSGINSKRQREKARKTEKFRKFLKKYYTDKELEDISTHEFNDIAKNYIENSQTSYCAIKENKKFIEVLLHHESLSHISQESLNFLKSSKIIRKEKFVTRGPYQKTLFSQNVLSDKFYTNKF